VWRPLHSASHWVVNSVIIDVDRHAENVHGHVRRHDEEQAVDPCALVIKFVVFSASLDPLAVDLEVNGWQLVGALREDDSLLVAPVIDVGLFEKVANERLVPDD